MKGAIIVCVLALSAIALARPDNAQYTDKYDNIDVEQILGNKRLLMGYVQCVLEKGKCTAEGKELKSHVKDALETRCAKCTETQRKGSERVLGHLINNEPEYWNELKAKYDPTDKYSKKYETELTKIKTTA